MRTTRAIQTVGMAVVVLFVVTACGPVAVHQGPSTTSALFAVLEARGSGTPSSYNTVAIAGLDGRIRAETTFAPMSVPSVGCMGAILPASAHVAAGEVFYADGHGVVRSLAVNGKVSTVATFPVTSGQQMLSFAVSPDGTSLLGTVFAVPTDAFPCDGSPSTRTYSFDAYSAMSGGPTKLLSHQTWTQPQNVLALTGWDAQGPIGTFPTVWASQGGGPGSTLGVFVRVDSGSVKVIAPFSAPASCVVWDSVSSGAFVCTEDPVTTGGGTADQKVRQSVSIRNAGGAELWNSTVTGQNAPFGPLLAPDGQHVMICCNDLKLADPHELLVGRDGSQVDLAKGFNATGWIDATTAIGNLNVNPLQQPPLPIAYVAANAPGTAVSMGFSGRFVGAVGS